MKNDTPHPDFFDDLAALCASRDDSGLPMYQRLIEKVSMMIDSGRIPDGTHLPPDTVAAARIGISHVTWAKVLNELRKRGVVERSQMRGTVIRRPMRKAILGGTGDVIIVFMDDINITLINQDFMMGVQSRLAQAGYRTAFVSAAENRHLQYLQIIEAMRCPEYRGGIIWSLLDDEQRKDVLSRCPIDFPLVFMSGCRENEPNCELVCYDRAGAVSEVAESFLASGGKSFICMICERHMTKHSLGMIHALQQCLLTAGLPLKNLRVIREEDLQSDIKFLLDRDESSLLIAADEMEIGALKNAVAAENASVEQLFPALGFINSGTPLKYHWDLPIFRFDTRFAVKKAVDNLLRHLKTPGAEYQCTMVYGMLDGNGKIL